MIRIEAIWLSVEPLDMRAGTDTALARVVQVFGAAHTKNLDKPPRPQNAGQVYVPLTAKMSHLLL